MTNSPLKYHGGKHYLAPWIIDHFPKHVHYVEPYFGGGSVLLHKDAPLVADHSEVANDVYGDLMRFWKVIASRRLFREFVDRASRIPFSEQAWRTAVKVLDKGSADDVRIALSLFIMIRQSRQGLGRDFATLSRNRVRRGMNEQVSAWKSSVDGLDEVHERISRVVVMDQDAIRVIKSQDDVNTLFYLDPPYVSDTRSAKDAYAHEMSDADHRLLLKTLRGVSGKFILSGYDNSLYSKYASRLGWHVVRRNVPNHASSKSSKATKVECLWMNFKPRKAPA